MCLLTKLCAIVTKQMRFLTKQCCLVNRQMCIFTKQMCFLRGMICSIDCRQGLFFACFVDYNFLYVQVQGRYLICYNIPNNATWLHEKNQNSWLPDNPCSKSRKKSPVK